MTTTRPTPSSSSSSIFSESCKLPPKIMATTKENPHRRRRGGQKDGAPRTLPSSPTRSFSSSSDFEFTVVVSPRKSTSSLCPADELFYKGQLLPLHLSPRISMVRTLLLSASSCSSSDASRDSTGSSTDSLLLDSSCCDSSRPSSVTADHHPEYDGLAKLSNGSTDRSNDNGTRRDRQGKYKARNGYFGLPKFSSVFRKEIRRQQHRETAAPGPVKRMSATAKEVIGKYLKKVKPIYEKLSSQKQHQPVPSGKTSVVLPSRAERTAREIMFDAEKSTQSIVNPFLHSFSGNLRYPRKRSRGTSCPSSMRSSPSHSGVLVGGRHGFTTGHSDVSSMEELQSAIQGAIAHCKNSMLQNKVGNGGGRLD